jgi:hypothetical protein
VVSREDPEFFNPAAHVKVEFYNGGLYKCACTWVGMNFDMHLVAMQATYDVLAECVIEEEE